MTITADLLDRWKKAKDLGSDRQAAIALGVSHTAIQHWRDASNAPAAVIERMARDLGHKDKEIAVFLFESMAQATKADADSRKTFERLAKKVQALALTAVAVLASSSLPAPAEARQAGHDEPLVSIMRTYANYRGSHRAPATGMGRASQQVRIPHDRKPLQWNVPPASTSTTAADRTPPLIGKPPTRSTFHRRLGPRRLDPAGHPLIQPGSAVQTDGATSLSAGN